METYLQEKWGIEGIVYSSTGINHGSGSPTYDLSGKFGHGITFDGTTLGKSINSSVAEIGTDSVSLSFWINPESEDFYLFNVDGMPIPASISLRKQRPLFSMLGLDQTSLPGTSINEFWAHGYLPLNKWSHLVLSYDLVKKNAKFFINGEFDSETSFAGSLPFPLSDGFRLGPTDDYQALSTRGGIDDFRVYEIALSYEEVRRLYADGEGDLNRKTIHLETSPDFENPKTVDVRFLGDGLPLEVSSSGSDAFELV